LFVTYSGTKFLLQIFDEGSVYFTFNPGNKEYKATMSSSGKFVQTERLRLWRTVANQTVFQTQWIHSKQSPAFSTT